VEKIVDVESLEREVVHVVRELCHACHDRMLLVVRRQVMGDHSSSDAILRVAL